MSALLALVPWYWRWAMIAALAAAVFGYGWMRGARHGEEQLEAFRAQVEITEEEQLNRQADRKRLSDAFIAKKDEKRENDLRDAHGWWAAYVDGLQRNRGAGAGAKPIREAPKICNDAARDQRLSGALAVARGDLRERLAAYRTGVGRLLERCQLQTADLIDVQEWAQYEQLLNHQPEGKSQ